MTFPVYQLWLANETVMELHYEPEVASLPVMELYLPWLVVGGGLTGYQVLDVIILYVVQ